MGYKRCPICELNYIRDTEDLCDVCANKHAGIHSSSKPEVKHHGRNIFMVFQGKNYQEEIANGYICAPYEDAAGNSPAHWAMLENVNPGDLIFHGFMREIAAISVATSSCFSSQNSTGETIIRKVDCKSTCIRNKIATKYFQEEIIITCANLKYQPFDKNGDGRQGYLFDLNDKLAGIFTREIINKNPDVLKRIPELKDLENL